MAAALPLPAVPAAMPAPLVAERLKKLYPNQPLGAVHTTPIPGLYEVQAGPQLAYTDETGRFFVFGGTLVDFPNRVNLSEQRQSVLNRIDASTLPVADAITIQRGDGGNGKRTLYVFSDPQCPYCQKLERDIHTGTGLDNVTIHLFLFPIVQIHPGAGTVAQNIWCASDKADAWVNAMVLNQPPPEATCDNPVARNVDLANKLNINGTPTIFRGDGLRLTGYGDMAGLESFLAAQ